MVSAVLSVGYLLCSVELYDTNLVRIGTKFFEVVGISCFLNATSSEVIELCFKEKNEGQDIPVVKVSYSEVSGRRSG